MKTLRWCFLSLGWVMALSAAPSWRTILDQPDDWYATDEARAIAGTVIQYQTESGGWPKNIDMTAPLSAEFLASTGSGRAPTIDNGATTTQLRLLARVAAAIDDETLREAVRRGLRYLLDAQYENGGWPQFYPLRSGYYTHITYNDDAMIDVLEVVRDAAAGEGEWADVAFPSMSAELQRAVERGVACLLATQVRVDGQLTAWCAQHDAKTLAPAPARTFEPVSLSGAESAGIVRFLMSVENPTPPIEAAIEAAVRWFERVAIPGHRVERPRDAGGKAVDQILVADAAADVWARFYEIGTNRPIFAGRDAVVRYDLAEVELERRLGYGYYRTEPASLLLKDYPAWRRRVALASDDSVLFLAGDSTVADKPRAANPERGWGQLLREFALPGLRVDNRAVNGRSTKSFIDEGRWDALVADLDAGDWVLIQFGHNDEKSQDPTRYADPGGAYRDNLIRMVQDVRARGATPLLATSVARRKWDGDRMVPTHGEYPAAVRAVAELADVPLLDMEALTTAFETARGIEGSKDLHLWFGAGEHPVLRDGKADDTHYSFEGARAVARLAVTEMQRLGLPLARQFADTVVALDDRGDYTSIERAVYGAQQQRAEPSKEIRWTILVKPGIYRERVYVQRERGNIALVGTDPQTTTLVEGIHANMPGHDGKPIGTFRTPTLQVDGDGFIVENLTIANDAGPVGQALAIRVDGDRVVFRHCRFLGWQDTILVNRGRHYFADSYIEGHVDFIFGGATAVFDRCHIHCVGKGYITAASTPMDHPHGLVFLDGRITGEPDVKTFLGRPWRAHGQTSFVRTQMSEVVRTEGWDNWRNPDREKTARYAEFGSTGEGGATEDRVTWARQLTAEEAATLTPTSILVGEDGWEIPLPISR
ncbi:pectate lyase [Synoicihabitans lomoniglobus]|uniref:Pectate lyase n=1 Tax=Synoicihabitans lomoniglobus TaxID=2909285 RepID=A0AAE9ZZB2_9BACT|nr:pectate lyase [Opitutaceae bacterium LMO-M01]WED63277.1 pectate lyase [Opitutaceae bacterium LMO-M01]